MIIEKRKNTRFLVPPHTFAALGRKYTRVGKIKNISLGGLSFEYITGENSNQNSSSVDIFLIGNIFHLHNVPCKTIYDISIHIPYVNNQFIKILTTRRCGLQFEQLTDENNTKLILFLENHGQGIST